MRRTQIYLDDDQHDELRRRARREGRSMAELIRELLRQHLETCMRSGDPFGQVIGIAQGDGSAVAEHHADYLYGDADRGTRRRARRGEGSGT